MAATDVEIARAGEFWGHWQGGYELTADDLERMVANFRPPIVIDYEHESIVGEGAAPAAGWVSEIWVDGDSLYGRVDWTPRAEEMIDNDEYRYLSPVFDFEATDPETGNPIGPQLVNVALTNMPFIEGMETVQNHESGLGRLQGCTRTQVRNSKRDTTSASDASGDDDTTQQPPADADTTMDWEKRWNAFLNRIKSVLNTDGSDELDVLDEARQLKEKAEQADQLEDDLQEAKNKINDLQKKLDAQEEARAEEQRQADEQLVDEAIQNYKIPKSKREDYLKDMRENREKTRAVLNALPEGVHNPSSDSPEEPEDTGSPATASDSGFMSYARGE